MDTPLCDFVRRYADSGALRLHMPGHKGAGTVERLDITEIDGADVLYAAQGVLRRSQDNAARCFGTAATLYSTEGSSLAIRAMLCLARLHALEQGRSPLIAAGRNAHRSFLSAAALLGLELRWLYPAQGDSDSLLSCNITAETLRRALAAMEPTPTAVYLTSPDYLGNLLDIPALAQVCRAYGALLLIDNAHGAYLRFLPGAPHPIAQGAQLCCDSAHKTLPVLTGGAYLHLAESLPPSLRAQAAQAMALFASTSPSYLILQSLDAVNRRLATDYPARLGALAEAAQTCRARLRSHGYTLAGQEPLKLTLRTKPYGYSGTELAACLAAQGIVCEFSDPDFLVAMLSPETGEAGLHRLEEALLRLPRRTPLTQTPPLPPRLPQVCTPREALLAPSICLPVEDCVGRVLAQPGVSCPPAIPIAICGERLDAQAVACLRYYGISHCHMLR